MNGIFNYMDCSTCHITEDVAKSIMSIESISVNQHETGWWLHVIEDECIEDDVPDCIRKIMSLAYDNGAIWVKLDCDGFIHDSLPRYEW